MGAEDGEFLGEPSQRLDQGVELAAGQQLIEAAETKQDVLLDLATHPVVIHDEQIGPGTVGLRANEQIGAPVSLSWPRLGTLQSLFSAICRYFVTLGFYAGQRFPDLSAHRG